MRRRDFIGTLGAGIGTAAGLGPSALFRGMRSPAAAQQRFIERWSWAMGQPVHLQLFASSDDHGYSAAEDALAELRALERQLSLFSDASDLSELNRSAGRRPVRVGSDLLDVLHHSLQFEHSTGGAFNPAVEPLMRAWGFRTHRTVEPTAAELSEARQAVLTARVQVSRHTVSLPVAHTLLDLGGIGVGYALDRAMARLRAHRIQSAFLDVSGDCLALGAPPGEAGWRVDIAGPHPGSAPIASTRLRDAALATSSNTMSVVRFGRAVRGHVMNPGTGWPADALTQVSVVARTGVKADALSTAMLVAGRPFRGVLRYYRV
jgi:thiamine biosynthesis lipoprotein